MTKKELENIIYHEARKENLNGLTIEQHLAQVIHSVFFVKKKINVEKVMKIISKNTICVDTTFNYYSINYDKIKIAITKIME